MYYLYRASLNHPNLLLSCGHLNSHLCFISKTIRFNMCAYSQKCNQLAGMLWFQVTRYLEVTDKMYQALVVVQSCSGQAGVSHLFTFPSCHPDLLYTAVTWHYTRLAELILNMKITINYFLNVITIACSDIITFKIHCKPRQTGPG